MAITEIIRRGNQRRTRAIAQRSIGGLSAVGLGAAVLFTGITHHPHVNSATSSAASGAHTVTVSSTSATGGITMTVKYDYRPAGRIRLESVAFSGDSKAVTKHSEVLISFGPGLIGSKPGTSTGVGFTSLLHPSHHHFSGSLSAKSFPLAKPGLPGNGSVRITVENSPKTTKRPVKPVMTAVAILTR